MLVTPKAPAPPMRLSAAKTQLIVHCVRQQFGADAQVMLFGSRLDDTARGGDVDLLIESEAPATLHQRALVTMALEKALNLPVDIVAPQRGAPGSAFARIARSRAQPLEIEKKAALITGVTGQAGACLGGKSRR